MTAIGTTAMVASGAGALGYGAMAGATGTTLAVTGALGTQLATSGQAGREAEQQQEQSELAQAQADADARALQERLEREDYLMRIQSGIDSKTGKSSKTQYGTGSTGTMTGGDLLIPISDEEKKKKSKVGLGF
jgi:hypothetical protein